jgi:hypothetical protein
MSCGEKVADFFARIVHRRRDFAAGDLERGAGISATRAS